MSEKVVLVNNEDHPIGVMDKLEAHEKGLLHRAFSVFIFNSKNELLMQRRALEKYHSGGLWTNTCCSHPRPGEELEAAAKRRLKEEMGLKSEVGHLFSFIYKISFADGLTEHELDHVFLGYSNEIPSINKSEVAEWQYKSLVDLRSDIALNPSHYTEWLKISFERIFDHVNKNKPQ
jgi:isopentenyl-diphosphate delta-isomerase